MPSDFDIIVRRKDTSEILLICEVKMLREQIDNAELHLKEAMARLSCPLGLLFTPELLRIYLDRYTSDNPVQSIGTVGDFDARPLLRHIYTPGRNGSERDFETAVQNWLESLPQTFSSEDTDDKRLAAVL